MDLRSAVQACCSLNAQLLTFPFPSEYRCFETITKGNYDLNTFEFLSLIYYLN